LREARKKYFDARSKAELERMGTKKVKKTVMKIPPSEAQHQMARDLMFLQPAESTKCFQDETDGCSDVKDAETILEMKE